MMLEYSIHTQVSQVSIELMHHVDLPEGLMLGLVDAGIVVVVNDDFKLGSVAVLLKDSK